MLNSMVQWPMNLARGQAWLLQRLTALMINLKRWAVSSFVELSTGAGMIPLLHKNWSFKGYVQATSCLKVHEVVSFQGDERKSQKEMVPFPQSCRGQRWRVTLKHPPAMQKVNVQDPPNSTLWVWKWCPPCSAVLRGEKKVLNSKALDFRHSFALWQSNMAMENPPFSLVRCFSHLNALFSSGIFQLAMPD